MNWLSDKFNRCHSLKLQFENDICELSVFYNKGNLYTGFQLDQTTYERTKRGNYSSGVFFDLNKSLFCKTFLDTKNFYTNTMDIKNQFTSIYPHHKDLIRCELSETIVLSKQHVRWSKVPQDNSLTVSVFRLSLYENDMFYVLAERQFIDTILGKKIVRSSAYQIQTEEAKKYTDAAAAKYNTTEVKRQPTEQALASLFNKTENKSGNDRKTERCGVL